MAVSCNSVGLIPWQRRRLEEQLWDAAEKESHKSQNSRSQTSHALPVVCGSVAYFRHFCVDTAGVPEIPEAVPASFGAPTSCEAYSVPRYHRVDPAAEAPQQKESASTPKRSPGRSRDPSNAAATLFQSRYHQEGASDEAMGSIHPKRAYDPKESPYPHLEAGKLSVRLHEALGIPVGAPPPYIVRFRRLGFPPGYLSPMLSPQEWDKPDRVLEEAADLEWVGAEDDDAAGGEYDKDGNADGDDEEDGESIHSMDAMSLADEDEDEEEEGEVRLPPELLASCETRDSRSGEAEVGGTVEAATPGDAAEHQWRLECLDRLAQKDFCAQIPGLNAPRPKAFADCVLDSANVPEDTAPPTSHSWPEPISHKVFIEMLRHRWEKGIAHRSLPGLSWNDGSDSLWNGATSSSANFTAV